MGGLKVFADLFRELSGLAHAYLLRLCQRKSHCFPERYSGGDCHDLFSPSVRMPKSAKMPMRAANHAGLPSSLPFNLRRSSMNKQLLVFLFPAFASFGAAAQDATFQSRSMTPDTALKAARSAIEACRAQDYQPARPLRRGTYDRSGIQQGLDRSKFQDSNVCTWSRNATGKPDERVALAAPLSCRRRRAHDRSGRKNAWRHWRIRSSERRG
ncbi:MAG: hypothetical protein FD134_1851 [Gallionellaceae bacterium]|nr:MAG: hypothetical protein FD134_1851 [Gallionellaceae bacterium]